MTLTGYDAIDYAREHGLMLNKYADFVEDARDDVRPHEAEDIAAEGDPELLYIEIEQ